MTEFTLKLWSKPGIAPRIYINGGPLNREDKLYIFAAVDGLTGKPGWDAKLYSAFNDTHLTGRGYGGNAYDMGLNLAEKALKECGLDKASFAEIAATLEG